VSRGELPALPGGLGWQRREDSGKRPHRCSPCRKDQDAALIFAAEIICSHIGTGETRSCEVMAHTRKSHA